MNIDIFQKTIHRLEVGGGLRYLRITLLVLAVFILLFLYDFLAFKNMSTQEAMDSAQLARNLAQGKGYTTLFIRPFSLNLIQKHSQKLKIAPQAGNLPDPAQVRTMHPDLANPPLYPALLMLAMKVIPFDYTVPTKPHRFWAPNGIPMRYQPDFLIALVNQLLFVATSVLIFLLARRLFNKGVAWLSVALMLGTELFWRFSTSGLSTMLLMLLFTLLVWCLVLLEEELREPRWGAIGAYALPALAGLLVGGGALTRYSFGWLIVPVILYIIALAERRRAVLGGIVLITFALVLTPWIIRNLIISDTPLGTATYTLLETSGQFPEHRLERSVEPDLSQANMLKILKDKLIINGSRKILQNDLPKIGGSWVSAFCLVGLVVVYQQPAVRRLRLFLLGSLVVLAIIQAAGRTQLSEDSPEINSENLLVLLAPFLLVYGSSLFFLLLEQVEWPFRELRYAAIAAFTLLACLPLILTLVFAKPNSLAYPPYYPEAIQTAATWVNEDELTMSDVPWAVAWYGQSQCVWLTLNAQSDFFAINDFQKSVQELYLTQVTTDTGFMTHWLRGGDQNWGIFILGCIYREIPREGGRQPGPPAGFPLPYWQKRLTNPQGVNVAAWPDTFLLTARQQPIR